MTSHVLENMQEVITNDYTNYHQAVDIVANGNNTDDVVAIGDGVVEMVVKDFKYTNHNTKGTDTYGNFVKIKHETGKKTLYAHLKHGSIDVDKGQAIIKGQKIGSMGQTGNAYGAHLHFEVRNQDESHENPNDYLNGNKTVELEKQELQEEVAETKEEKSTEIIKEADEKTNEIKEVDEIKEPEEKEETINEEEKNESEIETPTYLHGVISDSNPKEEESKSTLENKTYNGGSIVDGLKDINVDSSFDNRILIAEKNGINNYRGTYEQNVYLLRLLKQGKLKS